LHSKKLRVRDGKGNREALLKSGVPNDHGRPLFLSVKSWFQVTPKFSFYSSIWQQLKQTLLATMFHTVYPRPNSIQTGDCHPSVLGSKSQNALGSHVDEPQTPGPETSSITSTQSSNIQRFDTILSFRNLAHALNLNNDQAVQLQQIVFSCDSEVLESVIHLCETPPDVLEFLKTLRKKGNGLPSMVHLARNLMIVEEATMFLLYSIESARRQELANYLNGLKVLLFRSGDASVSSDIIPQQARRGSDANTLSPLSRSVSGASRSSAGSIGSYRCPNMDCKKSYKYPGSLVNHVAAKHPSMQHDPSWTAILNRHMMGEVLAAEGSAMTTHDPETPTTPHDTLLTANMAGSIDNLENIPDTSPQQLASDIDEAQVDHNRLRPPSFPYVHTFGHHADPFRTHDGPSAAAWASSTSCPAFDLPSNYGTTKPAVRLFPPDAMLAVEYIRHPTNPYSAQSNVSKVPADGQNFSTMHNSFSQQR
jgi:hypothetical protein